MDIEKTKAEFEKSECFKRFEDVVQHTFFDFGTYCIRTDVPRDVEKKIEKLVSGLIFSWKAWKEAKAQAVPENKIEFDGEYIKYPNSYAIHCQFDEDFDCHIFDVYQNEDCVKDGMTQLKQAHLFVCSMSEAQEPTND